MTSERSKRCRSSVEDSCPAQKTPALVVFAGASSIKWLRWLRPGFQHCFVALSIDTHWVVCDPLSNRTEILVLQGRTQAELATWYRHHGLTVVESRVTNAPLRPAPIRPFTCVEAVKRILGIHAPWTLTPWQLYRKLIDSPTG